MHTRHLLRNADSRAIKRVCDGKKSDGCQPQPPGNPCIATTGSYPALQRGGLPKSAGVRDAGN